MFPQNLKFLSLFTDEPLTWLRQIRCVYILSIYSCRSISGTLKGLKKIVPLSECSTYRKKLTRLWNPRDRENLSTSLVPLTVLTKVPLIGGSTYRAANCICSNGPHLSQLSEVWYDAPHGKDAHGARCSRLACLQCTLSQLLKFEKYCLTSQQ